ncbi:MAG: 30S ribosomal protein S1 [Chloroflexi bacterium]|nr:30S ribosomal protein S1 [Chloroflexota bacterium]
MNESMFDEKAVNDLEGSPSQEQSQDRVSEGLQPAEVSPDDRELQEVGANPVDVGYSEAATSEQNTAAMGDSPDPDPSTDEQGESSRSAVGGMQNLLDDYADEYRTPQRGDVLDGTIVRIDKDGIMVDIGTKSEGIVPAHEAQSIINNPDEHLEVGSEVLVYVIQPENQSGHVVLSLNRARTERGWRTVQKQFEEGRTIEAQVTDFNRGGLIVNINGVRGFVPISQVVGLRHNGSNESEIEERMGAMVGRQIQLKVIEVNRSRNRLILSERAAAQEYRVHRKDQLLAELREGEIRHGKVSSICDFGAFVDLGGADGLVHLSELSWGQVSHPREVVNVGDEVDVYVIGVDQEKKKIALSLRRSQPGPWARISEKYKVGDLVVGTVTKLATFGAFAKIEDGVEGLIHVSELGEGRVPHPKNVVKEGDHLTLRIIRIDPERRRLGLSLKRAQDETSSPAEGERNAAEPSDVVHAGYAAEAITVQGAHRGDPSDASFDGQDSV